MREIKDFLSQKLKEIQLEIDTIDMDSSDISIEVAESMITYLETELLEMRGVFVQLKSIKKEEEIFFFKEIKPEILGFLLYFNKIHTIQLNCPNGSNDTLTSYYQKELNSLTYFFKRNLNFYNYYRSKSTHFDECYFIRQKRNGKLCMDSVYFVMDTLFSTGYDYTIVRYKMG